MRVLSLLHSINVAQFSNSVNSIPLSTPNYRHKSFHITILCNWTVKFWSRVYSTISLALSGKIAQGTRTCQLPAVSNRFIDTHTHTHTYVQQLPSVQGATLNVKHNYTYVY